MLLEGHLYQHQGIKQTRHTLKYLDGLVKKGYTTDEMDNFIKEIIPKNDKKEKKMYEILKILFFALYKATDKQDLIIGLRTVFLDMDRNEIDELIEEIRSELKRFAGMELYMNWKQTSTYTEDKELININTEENQKQRVFVMNEQKDIENDKISSQEKEENKDRYINEKKSLVVSNQWNSRKNKILSKIRCLIKEEILENYSHIIENEEFFILLIKDIFVFLKNKTDLLNRLNIDQLREIPMMIYSIAKVSFSTQRAVYKETEFLKKISNLYGFIYVSINTVNEKVYVGQTFRTIEIEWGSILTLGRTLIRKKRNEEKIVDRNLKRYIVRAIAKYGSDIWKLKLIDIAYNKSELDTKETYYIVEIYDSMNPKKGYNLTEGGASGKTRTEVHERQSRGAKEMWQRPGMREKISKSITEAWQTPEYRKKQSEIMKKIAAIPENVKKRSEASKKGWNRPGQKEKISSAKKEAYKNDSKYKEMLDTALEKAHEARRIEITDIKQFLIDVKISKYWKEVVEKYPFKSRDTLNARLKEILEPFGIHNYTMAKKFLQHKNIDDVLKRLRDFRSRG